MDEYTEALLRNLPQAEPPEDLKERILSRIDAERGRSLLRWRIAYIMTVLALAGLSFWLGATLADSYLPDLLPLLVLDWQYLSDFLTEILPSLMETSLLMPLAAILIAGALIVLEASRSAPSRVKA